MSAPEPRARPFKTMPGTTPGWNEMPEFRPYRYKGTGKDTLTPSRYGPGPRPVPAAAVPEARRCPDCGYLPGAPGHQAQCGEGGQ